MFLQSDVLLIVPGIYLAVRYDQYLTAVVDRKMGIMDSFQCSSPITANNRTCAELALLHKSPRELDLKRSHPRISVACFCHSRLDFPRPAARGFKAYRAACGQRTSPSPDFFIGAHAGAEVVVLLTRDATRYRT